MQLSLHGLIAQPDLPPYRRFLAPISVFFVVMAFIAAPSSLEQKAHAAMHGICAQRPSHSLLMGGSVLPFDARMTGIYLGFLVAFAVLVATGRHRHAGFLSPGALVMVLFLVGAMALDGFNSLLTDLALPALYEPDNRLRLFTGMGSGVGLAIMLTMLMGMSLWRRPQARTKVVDRWWQPLALYGAGIPPALLILTGSSLLFVPATMLLVASATIAFAGLALVSIVMISGRENTFEGAFDLQPQIVAGVLAGIAVIGTLAIARFALESWANAPALS